MPSHEEFSDASPVLSYAHSFIDGQTAHSRITKHVPMRLPCVPLQEPDTSAYDAFLEQLAEDTKQYVIAVFKTLTATVPKAIIHAQVGLADPTPSS